MEEARKGLVFVGLQESKFQLIFDIKMDGKSTCKDWFFSSGHTTY